MEPIVVVMLSVWVAGGLVAASYVFSDRREQYGPAWERLGAAALAGVAGGGLLAVAVFGLAVLLAALF